MYQAFKAAGPTYALSVANTQHAAVEVNPTRQEFVNYASFLNSGAVDMAVVVAPKSATAATPTLVFPVDGTPTIPDSFHLPAAMKLPLVVAVPAGGFDVSAIGASAGPSIVYITPVMIA